MKVIKKKKKKWEGKNDHLKLSNADKFIFEIGPNQVEAY